MHRFSVTRNGKCRNMWRCDKCREEMKAYKPSD
jgi:predicted RNA-binding Zn-ribbon protein involved in translation (DUF1610 family)